MARIPVLVPDREPELTEEVDAVDLRREVGRPRLDEQPRRQQHGRHEHAEREDAAPATAGSIDRGPVCYLTGPRFIRQSSDRCVLV